MSKTYDLIIIGSGPAGLNAGIYAKRACLDTILFEAIETSGGQITQTYEVDNYMGLPGINGYDLSQKFRDHAKSLDLEMVSAKITAIEQIRDRVKLVKTKDTTYLTKTVILATGAYPAKLGVEGEDKFRGKGVSYCATCDGAFFKGKTVCVFGGGDVALEDAIFLSKMATKVYLIHRRDELRGSQILQNEAKACDNIDILWSYAPVSINGNDKIEYVTIKNLKDNKDYRLDVDGVFVAIGTKAESSLLEGKVEMKKNRIVADETCKTSVPGIFAAGDVRTKQLRQVITAAADGANAVTSVLHYLSELDQPKK